ncbi:MAG: DUF962 domain-containing protein [Myxococcales bacterium]|nr:DUF962 domain-containing protein [Myxococcales bacterium]
MLLNDEWKALLRDYRVYHNDPRCEATHLVGIPMILASLPLVFFAPAWGVGLFVVGWILQFIGHKFQGNPPKFFGDPRNLIVGALWWFDTVLRPFGLSKRIFGT